MSGQGTPTVNEALGASLADSRRAAGWTQTDLALLLRRRGVRWSPAIVGLVERGERHLRFTEAVILVRLLSPFGLELEGLADEVPLLQDVEDGLVDIPEAGE